MSDDQVLAPRPPMQGDTASLGKRVAKGAVWSIAATGARIASALVVLPILTRFLLPEDFGLLQIAAPFLFFLMVFSDLGMQPALIVARDPTDRLWSTAHWAGILFGFTVTILMILAAPAIADFYNEPRATPIVQVLSIAMLISGSMIVPGAWLVRKMSFRLLSIVEFISMTAGILTALGMAITGWGVWSLVGQQLVLFALKATLLNTFAGAPIRLVFSPRELKGVLGFGIDMAKVRTVWFFARNVDTIIIGRFLGATLLGYYSLAVRIMMMPIEIFSNAVQQVLLSAVGEVRDDPDRLRAAVLRTYRTIAIFTFPAMAGIAALAEPITVLVFGETFAPAAFPMMALAIYGALLSVLNIQGSVFIAIGRIDVMLRWAIFSLIIMIIFLLIGVNWGLPGASIAYVAAGVFCAPFNFKSLLGLFGGRLSDLAGVLAVQAGLAAFLGFAVFGLSRALPNEWSEFQRLAVCVPAGVALHAAGLFICERKTYSEVLSLLRSVLSR